MRNVIKSNQEKDREICKLNKQKDKLNNTYEYKLEVLQDKKTKANEIIKEQKEEIKELNNTLKSSKKDGCLNDAIIKELETKIAIILGRLAKNSCNSSIPTSKERLNNKVTNNIEQSSKTKGGQLNHKGITPKISTNISNTINYYMPVDYSFYSNWELTGNKCDKYIKDISFKINNTKITEYEYRNKVTGETKWIRNDLGINSVVTYGQILLNNYGNVSIAKTSELIGLITDGDVVLSHGTFCNFKEELQNKSNDDYEQIKECINEAKVLCSDHTSINVGGKNKNVLYAGKDDFSYFEALETKGISDSDMTNTLKDYLGILIHDHAVSFYKFGTLHQECLVHLLRKSRYAYDINNFK